MRISSVAKPRARRDAGVADGAVLGALAMLLSVVLTLVVWLAAHHVLSPNAFCRSPARLQQTQQGPWLLRFEPRPGAASNVAEGWRVSEPGQVLIERLADLLRREPGRVVVLRAGPGQQALVNRAAHAFEGFGVSLQQVVRADLQGLPVRAARPSKEEISIALEGVGPAF